MARGFIVPDLGRNSLQTGIAALQLLVGSLLDASKHRSPPGICQGLGLHKRHYEGALRLGQPLQGAVAATGKSPTVPGPPEVRSHLVLAFGWSALVRCYLI